MESFSTFGPDTSGQRTSSHCTSAGVFPWNQPKVRSLALSCAATLIPTSLIFAVSSPLATIACLAWLAAMARTLRALDQHAHDDGDVLTIDAQGILDRRLMSRRIAWQEIHAICRTDPERSKVVDVVLRWPKSTLGQSKWPVRIGAYCQDGYGIPAVTLNMVLLDGSVVNVIDAIAKYRPDLLHHSNRKSAIARAS